MKKHVIVASIVACMGVAHAGWFGFMEPQKKVYINFEATPQTIIKKAFEQLPTMELNTTLPIKKLPLDRYALYEGNDSVDGRIEIYMPKEELPNGQKDLDVYKLAYEQNLMKILRRYEITKSFQSGWEDVNGENWKNLGERLVLISPLLDYFNPTQIRNTFAKDYIVTSDRNTSDYIIDIESPHCHDKFGSSLYNGVVDPSLQPKQTQQVKNQGVGGSVAMAGANSHLAAPSGSNSGSAAVMGVGLAIGAVEWLLTRPVDDTIYDKDTCFIGFTVHDVKTQRSQYNFSAYGEKRPFQKRLRPYYISSYKDTLYDEIIKTIEKLEKEIKEGK